ncbi:curli production assembly/transport component CsgF [Flavobacterium sp. 103]|uniref:curli assembly protein CsgF n=1 Tax=unclassified Flavobacterium TaxID=196869 RepID=UPI000D5DB83F|nr:MULTISPECIES: curli assembly protein CsgF [unclassified Flavobacterium]PVX44900.1 curli production assembly/transport component CsgF [Flavobacterium sp. 103]QKJ62960.1 curli assembly protein CsgF [Flavobacterium sp. M31R6]
MKSYLALICMLGLFLNANAQALVYKPMNPNFGGDTFGYQMLLSSADAQNDFKDNGASTYKQPTQLERFKENLNNQLLNKISNSLFSDQFGSNGISQGTYNFGTLSVDVYPSNLGLTVDILDIETGEQTQVIVPGS